ncbi:hypothetical protein BY458DRAFT_522568 [Sporodiniella umbellata]|nr:hypothetical protein BY458DRAFT_522568 [Sporodiniella umbellata]
MKKKHDFFFFGVFLTFKTSSLYTKTGLQSLFLDRANSKKCTLHKSGMEHMKFNYKTNKQKGRYTHALAYRHTICESRRIMASYKIERSCLALPLCLVL